MKANLNIRLKRLQREFEELRSTFAKTPHVLVIPNEKEPPDEYVVIFNNLTGIGKKNGKLIEVKRHVVHIYLPHNYLEFGPSTTFKTPHYHPNIYPNSNKLCAFAGSFRASEALTDFVKRIGEIIQYKQYNLDSPANREAAEWTRQSERSKLFPLDKANIMETSLFCFNNFKARPGNFRKYL